MGILHDIIYCPKCGPQYKFSSRGVSWKAIWEIPITPQNVDQIMKNGLAFECDCGEKFTRHYDPQKLQGLAQQP